MQKFSKIVKTTDGENVLTNEYIDTLRKESSRYNFIAQSGGQENMLLSYSKIKIGGGSRGGSKGSPYSEDIVTPFGIRKMGDLKVGDTISSVNGGMQKVICITELGARKVYKVNFSDGTSVRCTNDHLWKARNAHDCKEWELWTLEMLMQTIADDKNAKFEIPVCSKIEFFSDNIYDDECLYKYGTKLANGGDNINNKYKFSSISSRITLMRGIMDEKGIFLSSTSACLKLDNKQLVTDIVFILQSLGYIAFYNNAQEALFIIGTNVQELFKDIRLKNLSEQSMLSDYKSHPIELIKQIENIEFVGYDKCRCIAVSDVSALYVTTDFNVTHNSFSLLMEALYDITNPNFNATVLRNERNDLTNIINESYNLYSDFGNYNKSLIDMTWNFRFGGKLKFDYYNDPSLEEFKKRFQGKQFSYIGIDEITQMPYERFKYITTDNRNAYGIPNRMFGTCNPDPDCWVRPYIDWWIGEDGFPIPERDSVERFCFMDGDSPSSIIWGSCPDEVYEQCHNIIDDLWKPEYESAGLSKKTAFIQSVTFVKSSLEDNKKLLLSDPTYLANLAQQSEEQRERDLKGNWNFKTAGDDMIKMSDLETMFQNPEMITDGVHYASCDLAFSGGDNLVLWHWIGYHIVDLFVCRNDARTAIIMVKQKLAEWNVDEKHFTYDMNGIGQTFKGFFPDAVPFNNMAAPLSYSVNGTKYDEASVKSMYSNLKSQCAFLFVGLIKKEMISISGELLDLKFSGDGFEKMPLRQILQRERKCIRRNDDKADSSFALINKKTMKKYVGHSPDFFEGLIYRMIFDINKKRNRTPKGLWMI